MVLAEESSRFKAIFSQFLKFLPAAFLVRIRGIISTKFLGLVVTMKSFWCYYGEFETNLRRSPIPRSSHIKMPQIFISRPDLPESALQLLRGYELDIWEKEDVMPRETFLKRIVGKDALYIHSFCKIDVEALDAAGKNLKVIGTLSAGLDHIDVEEVKKRGIKLGMSALALTDAVAELAVALCLASARRIFEGHKDVVLGDWPRWTRWNWMTGKGLKGSVVGIFGMGRIGLEIAKRVTPFKPSEILYTSRKEKSDIKAQKVSLEELLKRCDVIFISVALNQETKGIINEERIHMMKSSAILVNISRGAVINQDALVKALQSKRIHGAALDVMYPEPLPKDHVLLSLDNCIITPHIGSAEVSTRIQMAETVSRNIVAALEGTPMPEEV